MPKKKNKTSKLRLMPRLMAWVFVALAAAQTVAAVGSFSSPEIANAQETFKANVPIGQDIVFDKTTAPIAAYVKSVYTYAVGAVGILAAVMLMIGGLRWILAGGNPSSIGEAKEMIFAAITGMVLVLTSYIVLSQVNPALVNLSSNVTSLKFDVKSSTNSSEKNCSWTETQKVKTGSETTSGTGNTGCPPNTPSGTDSDCAATKKPGDNYACCCSYQQQPGCSWAANNTCQENQTKYSYSAIDLTGSSNNLLAVKLCGSNVGSNQTCCCPTIPPGCPNDYKINCKACDNCTDIYLGMCKNASSCKASPEMAEKLKTIYMTYSGWQVTEAWPPTDHHIDPCHTDGRCVDLNFTDKSEDPTKVDTMAKKLKAANLTNFQYECTSGPTCCDYYTEASNCKYNKDASANHFHVE